MSVSIIIVNKDEPALVRTLAALAQDDEVCKAQILVVDASERRLEHIKQAYPDVDWIDFDRSRVDARITIAHQRNVGIAAAEEEVIVFIDSGCVPFPGWLSNLTEPILSGPESIVCGSVKYTADEVYAGHTIDVSVRYLEECPTINLAFRREVIDLVGGFDEDFEYGSDVDFSWRAIDAGLKIKFAPQAAITHDWGGFRRQLKRSYQYGAARARLYRKHTSKLPRLLRRDMVALAYPLFILGLPLTLRYRAYPLLLAIPAWRARKHRPLLTILDHLVYGLGVLSEVSRMAQSARSSKAPARPAITSR